jgi:hypothetical protein
MQFISVTWLNCTVTTRENVSTKLQMRCIRQDRAASEIQHAQRHEIQEKHLLLILLYLWILFKGFQLRLTMTLTLESRSSNSDGLDHHTVPKSDNLSINGLFHSVLCILSVQFGFIY